MEIGRFFAGMLAILMLCIIPLRNAAIGSDNAAIRLAEIIADEFVEEAGYSGRISQEEYERFCRRLHGTGTVYEIDLFSAEHLVTEDGEDIYQVLYTDELLDLIYGGEGFCLTGNASLTVKIRPATVSVAASLANFLISGPTYGKEYITGWKV